MPPNTPSYRFEDLGKKRCSEIVKERKELLLGKLAVNTAFDSGLLESSNWPKVGRYSLIPAITTAHLNDWPASHDAYCDEWWVFDDKVPADFAVNAFCSFTTERITNYKALNFQGGCPLDTYLEQFRPLAVFGNNDFGYWISPESEA